MKKILSLCLMLVLFAACGSLDQKSQSGLKGNWTITSVTYPGSEYIKVTSFDVADSQCFVGSSWNFISNNNKGTMTVAKGGCPSFSSPIVWTVTKTGDFTLKITEGQKAKRVSEGYFLKMQNQTENSFQLVDNVTVGGKTVAVTYNFSKI
ncbi:lipocalin family protein [Flavobacterium sp. RHBU_3]|uniref:lipocalin family protein n=1 Tax=Flavobacterium sp. RHBU_3 TaxID=3391184 RepID=UPI0039850CF2